jgi:L-arabinonolactonase
MRFNDGRCDRQGRFWVGSMDDIARGPVGHLYRIDQRGCVPMLVKVAIPYSLCWSPKGDIMYFSDGGEPVIWAFDFDVDTGEVSNRRQFARMAGKGDPDGATVDAEGFVWSVRFGGGALNRFAPDGTLVRIIEVPVTQPSCCTFGGPNFETLYITTARQRLTSEAMAAQPLAGTLMKIDVGVRGLPEPVCAL